MSTNAQPRTMPTSPFGESDILISNCGTTKVLSLSSTASLTVLCLGSYMKISKKYVTLEKKHFPMSLPLKATMSGSETTEAQSTQTKTPIFQVTGILTSTILSNMINLSLSIKSYNKLENKNSFTSVIPKDLLNSYWHKLNILT